MYRKYAEISVCGPFQRSFKLTNKCMLLAMQMVMQVSKCITGIVNKCIRKYLIRKRLCRKYPPVFCFGSRATRRVTEKFFV